MSNLISLKLHISSIATRSTAARETTPDIQAMFNKPLIPPPPQLSVVNLEIVIPLHPDLVQTPK